MKILEKNENLHQIIKDDRILIDFYADWCGPCKMLAPVLEEINSIKIIKINVDIHQELAKEYGVMSIPTLILVENDIVLKKEVGYKSKEEVENFIKK